MQFIPDMEYYVKYSRNVSHFPVDRKNSFLNHELKKYQQKEIEQSVEIRRSLTSPKILRKKVQRGILEKSKDPR